MNSIVRSFHGDFAVALGVLVTMASACADATTTTVHEVAIPQGGPTAAQTTTNANPVSGAKVAATPSTEKVEKAPPAKDISATPRFREPPIHLRR
jgi:hypothetical protein